MKEKNKQLKGENEEVKLVIDKRDNLKRNIINVLIGVIIPFLTVFLTEFIQKQNALETFKWMLENHGIILLNYLIIYFVFYGLQVIFNREVVSFTLTSIIYFAFSIISYLKYEIRGEVLLVNDFSLINQSEGLLSFVGSEMFFNLPIILAIVFILIGVWILDYLKNHKVIRFNRKNSLIIFTIISVAIYMTFINKYTSQRVLERFEVDTEIRYDINSIHEKEGVILGLYSNMLMNNVQEPVGYSKEKVFEILENLASLEELESESYVMDDAKEIQIASIQKQSNNVKTNLDVSEIQTAEETRPNIIMIMSESFFDPTVLEGVNFSEDPIPNTRKLMEEYTSGKFISSTFAGGTSNIEFEAFTGNSIAYLPYGTVPYTDLKENVANIESLPQIMKDNGYRPVALHTYDKTFYNRDINYKNFGFDEFVGVDELYNPEYFGKYVSDDTFVKNIIKILEDNADNNTDFSVDTNADMNSNQPIFIWGVTMQNHTPYKTENYNQDLEIQVSGETLSAVAKDKLTAYVNGIYESDKATKKLIEYLEKSGEPTIVLFFGDHLPSQYETYFDTGKIHTKDTTKWTSEEMLMMHTIPFFIYDNFDYKDEYSHDELVGAAFLGNYLCNYVSINKPIYFEFLDTLKFKAVRDRLFVDENGNAHEKATEEYTEEVNNHKILQYDSLYGEKYIEEYVRAKAA